MKKVKIKKPKVEQALKFVQKMYPNVAKMTDASKNLLIEVTQQHSSSRAVRNHKECALAVACKQSCDLDAAVVSRSVVYLIKGNKAIRYMMPNSAIKEIVAFDRGAKFEPGEYELKAPTSSAKLGSYRGKAPSTRTEGAEGNLAKRFTHITKGIRASLTSREVEAA